MIKSSCNQINEDAETDIEISKKICEEFGAKLDYQFDDQLIMSFECSYRATKAQKPNIGFLNMHNVENGSPNNTNQSYLPKTFDQLCGGEDTS